ncbi:MAG: MarR family transcriptional regulator [Deltaproteobacteria bacterium]|nr:MarR family transcriptional regulator [Deltaproteobacteria bacterium]
MDRLLRRQDDAFGLTAARISALSVLVFHGPMMLGQLASHEQVSAPTMSRMIAALQQIGLVAAVNGREDRRTVEITATFKGKKLLQKARRRRVADLTRRLAGFSDAEIALLDRASTLLERIVSGR